MKKRFSWLLLYLFILSSCSDKYYKSAKNPHTVNYRGQRTIVETKRPTHAELNQRTKALMEANMNRKDFTEDDFHEVPPAMQVTTAVTQKYIEEHTSKYHLGTRDIRKRFRARAISALWQ